MKLTFLGTGTSTGVPSIACDCETCTSDDPRDKRLRVSVLIEHAGQTVIVDTSSDFRQQALRFGLRHLDAVLVTHCHADHIFGLDDIRPLNFRHGPLGLYANERAWRDIRRIFQYVFEPSHFGGGLPQIVPHTVVKTSRTCESCHANPRALGLGMFTSKEHPKLEEFRQPAEYRWDRIVDEEGNALQATTVDGARPLSREEMDRIRNAPYKLPAGATR